MPKSAEDVKMMQEKDAKIKDLEEKCKKLVSFFCVKLESYCSNFQIKKKLTSHFIKYFAFPEKETRENE